MKLPTIALALFFAFGSTLALAQGAGGGGGAGGAGGGGAAPVEEREQVAARPVVHLAARQAEPGPLAAEARPAPNRAEPVA
jgi:hypothetical protein